MYVHTLTVMPSDTSSTGEIKIRNLLNHFQDIAGLAILDLEGSPGQLMERGYAWVLLRYDLDVVTNLPAMDDVCVVKTYHMTEDGFHTLRVFEVFSPEGKPLVYAKTSWILIDLASQKPVRAGQRLPEVFADAGMPIDPEFRRISKQKPGAAAHAASFPVRFHDLDANGHVNNAVYFEWAYEATPLDLMEYRLRSMSADFRMGAKLGDISKVEVFELTEIGNIADIVDPRTFFYVMTRENRGTEKQSGAESARDRPLSRLQAVWTPRG